MTTILVADDMPFCREPIAESLRGRGYNVICAGNGAEVLAILKDQVPDLILLDMIMPKLDGLATLRTMRCNPLLKDVPVIMLTDRAEPQLVQEAAQRGIQGYLLKSHFSLEELFSRVEACLGTPVSVGPAPKPETGHFNQPPATGYAQWRAMAEQASAGPIPSAPRRSSHAKTDTTGALPAKTSPASATSGTSFQQLAPVITKGNLHQLVNKGLELRPLAPTVQNVISVTCSAQCSADDVAKAISQDQALSIRILKLANSSTYSKGRPTESVREAVQRIGVQEIRSLVMTLGVMQQFEGGAGEHLNPHLFWEHSIACGLAASAIAKLRQHIKADDAFMWGMVHDVGRLILAEHVSEAYGRVWEAAERFDLPLELVEEKLMLLDHCNILEKALEHWHFPREFIAPVVSHHHSVQSLKRLGPRLFEAAAVVALADRLAHALLLGSSGNDVLYLLDDLFAALQLKPDQMTSLIQDIPIETRDLRFSMLTRAQDETWPEYADQIKERLPEFRPLCVSAVPAVDAVRLFCEKVQSPPSDQPPNIGVLYLRDANELATLAPKFDAREAERQVTRLPVVFVVAKGKLDPQGAWLKARRHAALMAPVRIPTLVQSILDLLGRSDS